MLVATQGTGMVPVKDKPPGLPRAGDVAEVPSGPAHRHGASAAHLFARTPFIEIEGPGNTARKEPVDETHHRSVAVAPAEA